MRRVRANIVALEKAKNITYSESVFVASGIHTHFACVVFYYSAVACPAAQYLYTLSHEQYDFRKKKVFRHEMRALIFSTTFLLNNFTF
jgi:hypothetical protein